MLLFVNELNIYGRSFTDIAHLLSHCLRPREHISSDEGSCTDAIQLTFGRYVHYSASAPIHDVLPAPAPRLIVPCYELEDVLVDPRKVSGRASI